MLLAVETFAAGENMQKEMVTTVFGKLSLYSDLCAITRGEAFDLIVKHAEELGANAVIGVRYDATAIQDIATEVLCYGIAVVMEKI